VFTWGKGKGRCDHASLTVGGGVGECVSGEKGVLLYFVTVTGMKSINVSSLTELVNSIC